MEGEEGVTRLPSVWPQGGAVPKPPRGVSRAHVPAPLERLAACFPRAGKAQSLWLAGWGGVGALGLFYSLPD